MHLLLNCKNLLVVKYVPAIWSVIPAVMLSLSHSTTVLFRVEVAMKLRMEVRFVWEELEVMFLRTIWNGSRCTGTPTRSHSVLVNVTAWNQGMYGSLIHTRETPSVTVQVNVISSPGQTASPPSTDEVKIKQSMADINQYMHDTTAQCKSEDIVNVVRRYRLKNFQLLFCDCGVQGLSTLHIYSSRCEISMS